LCAFPRTKKGAVPMKKKKIVRGTNPSPGKGSREGKKKIKKRFDTSCRI